MTVPTRPSERALLPDALRGIAIGGILLINMQVLAGYVPWEQEGVDRAVQAALITLAQGKFVSLFALMFGAGLYVAVRRSGRRPQLRRVAALLLLGLAHGLLVWPGDILATYALVALPLLLVLRRPDRRLRWFIVAGLLISALLAGVVAVGLNLVPAGMLPPLGPELALVNAAYGTLGYAALLPVRALDYLGGLVNGVVFGPWLLAVFLVGVALERAGVLRDPGAHRRALRVALGVALTVGLPLSLLQAWLTLTPSSFAGLAWTALLQLPAGLALGLGYGAAVGLLAASRHARLLRPLANAGRMSLSNYLAQSVVFTLLFNGYGLGLYGTPGAGAATLLAVGFFALQVLASNLYLRRATHGPVEGLLRRFVYGRRQEEAGALPG